VFGAAAVVLSLVYVAAQVRQNTKTLRSSATAAAISSIRDWNRDLIADPALARVFRKGVEDMGSLDEDGRAQFVMIIQNVLKTYEDMHYQLSHGIMDPAVWLGWEQLGRLYFTSPGVQQYWVERRQIYSLDFQVWIESLEAVTDMRRMDAVSAGTEPKERTGIPTAAS